MRIIEPATERQSLKALLFRLLFGPADPAILNDASSWNRIKRGAGSEGVAPIIAFSARAHVSQAERLWCDRVLAQSWHKHSANLLHLRKIAESLDVAGVPVIALKGPVSALRHYDPPFLRKPSVDLDLAVREEHIPAACAALTRTGYRVCGSIARAIAGSHHVVLEHPSLPRVELHFRLSHGVSGVTVDRFFQRAVETEGPGGWRISVLHPADELLHLVLHMVQDRFATAFHLYEVHRIWNKAPQTVRDEAIRIAVDNHFAGSLTLADAAVRLRSGHPLLPPGSLPKTWLHWRLNEDLYLAMESNAVVIADRTLPGRLKGRWMDLQTTDRPADLWRSLRGIANVAVDSVWPHRLSAR
jgi:hypothetical protein